MRDVFTGYNKEKGGVLALGNFDGVHLGHRAVVERAICLAREKKVKARVMTFEPHPYSLFQKEKTPFLLTPSPQKKALLEALGVEGIVTLPFSFALAALSPEEFVRKVLLEGLAVEHAVIGFNFTFGAKAAGDGTMLRRFLEPCGVGVSEVPPLHDAQGKIVSSSRIREALRVGDPEGAEALLGRFFAVEGEVIHGDARGRTLGFATANIALDGYVFPLFGAYAGAARPLGKGKARPCVVNIGTRPTVFGTRPLLEAHILDFDEDIYGESWSIEIRTFLRKEEKFTSLKALSAQIAQDVAATRSLRLYDA